MREKIVNLMAQSRAPNGLWDKLTHEHKAILIEDMSAALTALEAAGYAVVPREPTMKQLSAGQTAWIADPLKKSSTLYRAMIAAAEDAP